MQRRTWIAACVILLAAHAASPLFGQEKTPIQVEDLYRFDAATDLALAPDLQRAVYVRDWAQPGWRWRRQALWIVEREAANRRALEAGEPDARKPVLSPDGRWIAFLSSRPFPDGSPAFAPVPTYSDPPGDIWLLPIEGGQAIPLAGSAKPYGRVLSDGFYGRVAFSPDGKRLAFVADDRAYRARSRREEELGITVVRDDVDQGEGYEGYGHARVWVADLLDKPGATAAASVRCVTPQDTAWYGDPQWSPDGTSLVIVANRSADRESVRFSINKNFDLWQVRLDGGELVQLTTNAGPDVSPRWSPDGRRLACLSVPRKGPHADVYNLCVIELGAAGPRTRILFDHHAPGAAPPHLPPTFPLPQDVWQDTVWLRYPALDGLASKSQAVSVDSPSAEQAPPDPSADAQQRAAARRRLTPPSNAYLTNRLLAEDRIVRWKSFDGRAIDGVLTVPPPQVASAPYRLLLYPHGGPHSRSSPGFNFTTQVFAAAGYAVFQPNFRGTAGYGLQFLDADRGDFGGGDMQDILTGIDHLVQEGLVDPRRQFVYGISYGGYLTSWLVGHTQQFRAAAPQNAVTDLTMMWALSDIQSWTEWEFGGRPWEIPAAMHAHSPLAFAGRVRTPTLVLHADHDRRCPLPMGVAFYRALQKAGVETQLVIYHDERHGISQLPHQEDIYRRVLAWFAQHDAEPAR